MPWLDKIEFLSLSNEVPPSPAASPPAPSAKYICSGVGSGYISRNLRMRGLSLSNSTCETGTFSKATGIIGCGPRLGPATLASGARRCDSLAETAQLFHQLSRLLLVGHELGNQGGGIFNADDRRAALGRSLGKG